MKEKVEQLRHKLAEIRDLHSAASLLNWDQETYMPPKAAPGRGEQLATISALAHRLFTSKEIGNLLQHLQDHSSALSPDEAKLVSETLYDYQRSTRLPESFVHEFSKARSAAFQAWVNAREERNYALFEPHLKKIVDLAKQKADFMGYKGSPYNALLEDFERGMTVEKLKPLFAELSQRQSTLIDKITRSVHQPDTSWTQGEWDEKAQWNLTLRILKDMGFDLEAGRQDKSVHPFTTGFDLYDVRITTRLNPKELFSALTSSMHEGGHALYEQGFRPEDRKTTLGEAISLGVHESQSRMWENIIGRSLAFWQYYTPALQEHFPGRLDSITPEQIFQAINKVEPSFIRVEADECTYNLHIILRFEIETALIEGELETKDVPSLWNEKIKQYLGLDVPDDALGCLQDIHWSHGLIGYFPTYTLGNLYAAQLFEMILQEIPDLWDQVKAGHFQPLLEWLRRQVHHLGRRMNAPELIQHITGREPSSLPFLNYLEKKYSTLYNLP